MDRRPVALDGACAPGPAGPIPLLRPPVDPACERVRQALGAVHFDPIDDELLLLRLLGARILSGAVSGVLDPVVRVEGGREIAAWVPLIACDLAVWTVGGAPVGSCGADGEPQPRPDGAALVMTRSAVSVYGRYLYEMHRNSAPEPVNANTFLAAITPEGHHAGVAP